MGYIITDLDLELDVISKKDCGKCDLCIRSCPSGAISENGFDMAKCISYLTQLKRELTEEEMFLVGKNLYGCDAVSYTHLDVYKRQIQSIIFYGQNYY